MKNLTTIFVLLCCFSAMRAQVPTNGLVNHFTFDNTLANATNTDTIKNCTYNGVVDKCGNANGAHYVEDLASSTRDAQIDNLSYGAGARTFSLWVKSVNPSATSNFFNYGNAISGCNYIYYDASTSEIAYGSPFGEIKATVLHPQNWTHIVATYTTNGISNLYINGVSVARSETISFSTVPQNFTRMGRSQFGDVFYGGYYIDDLMFYNRAITLQEANVIYEEQRGLRVVNNATVTPIISCVGDQITLNVDATGNNLTYQWNVNGTPINGATNNSYQLTSTGPGTYPYSVDITSAACQVSVSLSNNTTTANVYSRPTPTIVPAGNLLQTQGYNSYQWYLNGVPIADATGPNHLATQNGTYYVVVNHDGACPGTSPSIDVTLSTVGLAQEDISSKFTIYPNPTENIIHINSNEKLQNITIIDMYGKQVKTLNENVQAINVSELSKGMYSLRILTNNGKQGSKTFVKL